MDRRQKKLFFYEHFTHTNNYLYVLISLLALILLPSFSVMLGDVSNWVFRVCFSLTIFLSIYTVTDTIRDFFMGGILGIVTLLLFWGEFAIHHTEKISVGSQLVSMAFFAYVGFHLTRSLIHQKAITVNVIFGATVGYMLIGVLFGQICGLLETLVPGSFVGTHSSMLRLEFFYYSFITLTTVGYGDVVPSTDPARALGIIIALAGQMYMTVLIAILIGKFLSQSRS